LNAPYTKLLSTCERIPSGATYWANITNITISPVLRFAEFVPKLDSARTKNHVAVANWWRYETIYLMGNLKLNRRELVLAAVNKDGGAHVSHALDPKYEDLVNGAAQR
jgi:hypothetical protein